METIKTIFRTGFGPSSSHTMGPAFAAQQFLETNGGFDSYRITLAGSLAATGKGHLTDVAVARAFEGRTFEIIWRPDKLYDFHPNGILFEGLKAGKVEVSQLYFSVGGGSIVKDGQKQSIEDIYPHSNMQDILDYCEKEGLALWEYCQKFEGDEIFSYVEKVWDSMKSAVKCGIDKDEVLPGSLKLRRKSYMYYNRAMQMEKTLRQRCLVFAYALAVAEENAGGGTVVTAPTCGSCGVVPAVLFYYNKYGGISDKNIYKALIVAGLTGTVIRHNASISGAQVGCQGEIGSACSMASAAVVQLFGGSPYQIEYAAEIGLEHHLGLTCDPVDGLVQVPCIERNAFAAARAIDSAVYALVSDGRHRIKFDQVVDVMDTTGRDLSAIYRETSLGGLASLFRTGFNDNKEN